MATAPAVLLASASPGAIAVSTNMPDAPVAVLNAAVLRELGQDFTKLFDQYSSDRLLTEQKAMRNLRQYLGIYDPDILSTLPANGSRAYPRITRVKCISMLSRVMNLMFPGNEQNWELTASPSAEMKPEDVAQAVQDLMAKYQQDGQQAPPPDDELVQAAIQRLADQRAEDLSNLIKDQLHEIGGDQTLDYISLNRKVVFSGILYGLGVLEGPFLRTEQKIVWAPNQLHPSGFAPEQRTVRKPQYEFLSFWDYYPDLSAKTLASGDGYFIRKIMGRSGLRELANREDFFGDEIKKYLARDTRGNYRPKPFETELKTMGTSANVKDQGQQPHGKYEIIIWKGPISAAKLMELGVVVPEAMQADDVESELWMIDGSVIKADINAWRKMGCAVQTVHTFVFDEDDTSPIGNGLPNVCRDSTMSVAAAVRMALDNASVTCGPILELNTGLLRPGQDIESIHAYKTFERDDDGLTAQFPAVREIKIDAHLAELSKLVEMFMGFADMETFVGPATGGDMEKTPSEPMRTAAGASMLRGDAALPFKDIIRNFDFFTQSVILSLVHFNKKFNPQVVKEGDYDVIARGATSLIAKEVRGMQLDVLAQTLTPEDRDWIDEGKFVKQLFAVRDMTSLMVPEEEAMRKRAGRTAAAAEAHQNEMASMAAAMQKTKADAYKAITQGQKNSANADKTTTDAALGVLQAGTEDATGSPSTNSSSH